MGRASDNGRVSRGAANSRIARLNSRDWRRARSPAPVPDDNPRTAVELLWAAPSETLRPYAGSSVGLFGAIEVAHVHGPIVLDRPYRLSAEIVAVGQSPTSTCGLTPRGKTATGAPWQRCECCCAS